MTATPGVVTVTAGATPGFYHFSVTGTDNSGTQQTQGGWIVVGNPAATLTKSGRRTDRFFAYIDRNIECWILRRDSARSEHLVHDERRHRLLRWWSQ